jgi:hypothetical protein
VGGDAAYGSKANMRMVQARDKAEHIGQHLPGVVINGVPEPSRIRFRLHKTPHFVELRAEPTMHLQRIRAPDFHFDLRGIHGRQHAMIHRLQLRLFFSRVAN